MTPETGSRCGLY